MNFDIKTEQLSDDAYVISLAGEVDLYTAPEFKQQLLEVIGQGGKEVVVDFTTRRSSTRRRSACSSAASSACARTTASFRSSAATGTSRRSSRSRVSTGSSRSTRRATRRSRSSEPPAAPSRVVLARASGLARCSSPLLLLAGCGTGGKASASGDQRTAQKLFTVEVRRLPHARGRGRAGDRRAEPRRRLRGPDEQGFKQSTIRERRPRPDPPRVAADAARASSRPGRRRTSPRYVAAVAGRRRAAKPPARTATTASRSSRRTARAATRSRRRPRRARSGPNLDQLKPSCRSRSTRSRTAAASCRRSRARSPQPRSRPSRSSSPTTPASSPVDIRRARPDDAAAVAEVHVRTWQAAYEHVFGAERLGPHRSAPDASGLALRFAPSRVRRVRRGEDDGRIVGFVACRPSRGGACASASCSRSTCSPRRGGRAAASALMTAALARAAGAAYGRDALGARRQSARAAFLRAGGLARDGAPSGLFLGLTVPRCATACGSSRALLKG